MKFISWNVNGLRACLKKGFEDVFNALEADFFCIQETKMQPGQADFAPAGYTEYIYSADKKGYSGTAIWAKTPALSVRYGLDEDVHNHEGRAITLEYPDFYLVNLYVPNSQNELARIDYRMQWEDDLRRYLQKLDAEKPVILCGDLNVAHEDIDLKNPGPNRGADYKLVAGRNFIGRAAAMDVALTDDDTVSRESHALVTYDAKHNRFSLSPGQGRGITYCNDEQVEMVRPLNSYDVIEVGKSQLIFLPLCGEKFQWNEE